MKIDFCVVCFSKYWTYAIGKFDFGSVVFTSSSRTTCTLHGKINQ